MLEVLPIGGFKEIGRNCCAIKVDDEVVVLDLGLELENYISYMEEHEDIKKVSSKKLIEVAAVPDINSLGDLIPKVKGIIISHAHLDHVGAVPFLSNSFNCDVHSTPFTIEVLNQIVGDEGIKLKNKLVSHKLGSKFKLTKNIDVEFISITHSTPHTAIIVLHTKYGKVMYANDFKLDDTPVINSKNNYDYIGSIKPKLLIMDSLYADTPGHSKSEQHAKNQLEEVLLDINFRSRAVVVTTFASHIARLKTLLEIANKMNRKPVFIGRSMAKYMSAAKDADIIDFFEKAEVVKFGSQIKRFFKKVKHPEEYFFIVTGHQGEPRATLSKMVDSMFEFTDEDSVLFSCSVIPVPINIENRKILEEKIGKKKVNVYKDLHVSGHGYAGDLKRFLEIVKPEHLIPTHGDLPRLKKAEAIAKTSKIKNVHIIGNGDRLEIE